MGMLISASATDNEMVYLNTDQPDQTKINKVYEEALIRLEQRNQKITNMLLEFKEESIRTKYQWLFKSNQRMPK